VFDNVAFGLRTKKTPEAELRRSVSDMLGLLEIEALALRRTHQLSGGEQQRVALARALVTQPRVLLLDEPLSALDLKLREKMQLELLSLRKRLGMTFIFVTHDQSEAMVLSDKIAVMNCGRMEQIGTPEEIYLKPRSKFVASFIGHANFFNPATRSTLRGDSELAALLPGSETGSWMMRPEQLQVRRKGSRIALGHWGLGGRMGDIAFLGESRIGKFHDDLGQCHLVKFPRGEVPSVAEGEEALLTGRSTDMFWIPELS
jgi:spermidine/putrescine transport system ATP-binding protein